MAIGLGVALLLLLFGACNGASPGDTGDTAAPGDGGSTGDGGSGDGGAGDGGDASCTDCTLEDALAFQLTVQLDVLSQPQRAGQDTMLDWSALEHDMFGRVVDPVDDIDGVTLYRFDGIDQDALLDGFGNDALQQSWVTAFWTCAPVDARCGLSTFDLVGHPFIPAADFVADTGPWLLVLTSAGNGGVRSLALIEPRDDVTAGRVEVGDQTAVATLDIDLDAARLVVPVATPTLSLDWSALTVNGWGHTLEHQRLDLLRLDRLELAADQLASAIPGLDAHATDSWTADIAGLQALAFSDLQGDNAFAGIDADGTWLVTAWCTTCSLDLPRLAVLLAPGAN